MKISALHPLLRPCLPGYRPEGQPVTGGLFGARLQSLGLAQPTGLGLGQGSPGNTAPLLSEGGAVSILKAENRLVAGCVSSFTS